MRRFTRVLHPTIAMIVLASCSSDAAAPVPSAVSATSIASTPSPTAQVQATEPAPEPIATEVVDTTAQGAPAATFDPAAVGVAEAAGPITGGNGKAQLGAGGFDLSTVGYVEEEFFLSGTASAYESQDPLTSDGLWTVTPVSPEPYMTRIVVRRPQDPSRFNGSVAAEWLNVTAGFDNAPDWSYSHTELIRSGWIWVGVSAQSVGINGGGNALGAALALKAADPVRYSPLVHPGDSYSYDMFSQVGAALRTQADALLGGLVPEKFFAFGESQSAFRLTTYINAVAPLANVYDGYLVHSRGAAGAPLSQDPLPAIAPPDPTLIREDVAVPVLTFLSETDVVGERLGFARARQDDTDFIRAWEVPGTAHADVYNLGLGDTDDGTGVADADLFAAMSNPPTSIYGGVITCDLPINAGPHTYVLRAAIAALRAWVTDEIYPPRMPPIEIDDAGAIVVDEFGNATGGIRTPHLDVPIATLSGTGQTGESFCGLFGVTQPFDAAALAVAYPSHDEFLERWNESLELAVSSGAMLASDAEILRQVADASSIGS